MGLCHFWHLCSSLVAPLIQPFSAAVCPINTWCNRMCNVFNKYSVHFGTFGCQNKINSTSFFSTSFHCNALVCIEHITMAEVKLIFSKKPLLCLYQFGIYRKESVERSSEKKYSKMQYIQRNEMQRRTFYTEILQYKLIQCLQCNTKQCKEGG